MKTVLETLQAGAKYLEARGVPEARLNMEHLIAKVLGCERLDLYMDFDRPMAEAELDPLRDLLRRRGERVPLQHLLGEVEFLGRTFKCDARALVPRPETEELVGMLLTRFGEEHPRSVVDVGCGSGVIGLSLAAEWPEASVALVDISGEALALAAENLAALEPEPENVQLLEGELLAGFDGPFDLVVANLPYLASSELSGLQPEVLHDPEIALAAGPDGMELMRRLIEDVPGKLAVSGLVALEIGAGQGEALLAAAAGAGLRDAECLKDLSDVERFLLASR